MTLPFMDREEKGIIVALLNDDTETLETYLELKQVINIQLSLKTLDIPAVLQNSPPLIAVAIFLSAEKCTDLLAAYQSNLTLNDTKGRTSVHFAAACGETRILESLCKHGADLTCVDYKKRNAMHYAAQFQHLEIVTWLLAKKMTFNTDDSNRFTPLHFAAEKGCKEIVDVLLRSGMRQTQSDAGVFLTLIGLPFYLPQKMII